MTEQEWLTSTKPQDVLDELVDEIGATPLEDTTFKVSDYKLRMFVCACMKGAPNEQEWLEWSVSKPREGVISPSRAAEMVVGVVGGGHLRAFVGLPEGLAVKRAHLLREVMGNPFRDVAGCWFRTVTYPDGTHRVNVPTANPAWDTPDVVEMARYAYDTQDFSNLPFVADALEEAGCACEDLLTHLGSPGPHVRGCWVLDLLLGNG